VGAVHPGSSVRQPLCTRGFEAPSNFGAHEAVKQWCEPWFQEYTEWFAATAAFRQSSQVFVVVCFACVRPHVASKSSCTSQPGTWQVAQIKAACATPAVSRSAARIGRCLRRRRSSSRYDVNNFTQSSPVTHRRELSREYIYISCSLIFFEGRPAARVRFQNAA
jgi:hypothetical protein